MPWREEERRMFRKVQGVIATALAVALITAVCSHFILERCAC